MREGFVAIGINFFVIANVVSINIRGKQIEMIMKMLSGIVAVAALSACASQDLVLWPSKLTQMNAQPSSKISVDPANMTVDVKTDIKYPWPGVRMDFKKGEMDLSSYGNIAITISNTVDRMINVNLSVKSKALQGRSPGGNISLKPGEEKVMKVSLRNMPWKLDAPLEINGMNGYPSFSGKGGSFDISKTTSFHIFNKLDGKPLGFSVSKIVVGGEGVKQQVFSAKTFFPFVDKFGQLNKVDWPGKIHSEEELKAVKVKEDEWLKANAEGPIPGASKYGGWAAGPKLKATGFFRTEKVNGKWWLVDPDGYLFFSHGVDCVQFGDGTGVTKREHYYEWLPKKDDPDFGHLYYNVTWPAAHGFYKKPENFPYTAFSFAHANMIRKYGKDFRRSYAERAHDRIKAWGLNTIANWSDAKVYELKRTPYTARFGSKGPVIEGSTGWWGKFRDPFASEFEKNAKESAANLAKKCGDDPWCIGWFVDNELSWGQNNMSLAQSVLKSPAKQPAKRVFRDNLEKKYASIEGLNKAWGTNYKTWNEFMDSQVVPNEKMCGKDLEDFHREIVAKYYRTIRDAIKAVAPNRLYMGSRIAWGANVIYEEAARYCDVVSVNIYNRFPDRDLPEGAVDKPMINGEFHFGALDRGMFHTGLVAVQDQNERAQCYKNFVNACLDSERFVGTHWFQWKDQVITGRADGENYQIGFLTITDTPYPELVEAAREIGATMYERRYGELPWYKRWFKFLW